MYFCNARCLCLWAVHFVTDPRRPEEQKSIACELTMPSGERRKFTEFIEAAQWSLRMPCKAIPTLACEWNDGYVKGTPQEKGRVLLLVPHRPSRGAQEREFYVRLGVTTPMIKK